VGNVTEVAGLVSVTVRCQVAPEPRKDGCQREEKIALQESLAAAAKERAARTEEERKAAETARLEAETNAAARATAAAAGLSAEEKNASNSYVGTSSRIGTVSKTCAIT
jgi:hypothetical protein